LTILEDIRSRGHLEAVIRPSSFASDRVPFGELEDIIRRTSLRWRGWDFPHIDPHVPIERDLQWVGQVSAWNHHLEVWRIWASGQFVSISGFASEWRDRSEFWPPDANWEPGANFGILEVSLRYVEVFRFASRLSLTKAGDETMRIVLKTSGLEGRRLIMDDPGRFLGPIPYVASIAEFPYSVVIAREDLLADPESHAITAAQQLFLRFGLDMSEESLRSVLNAFNQQLGR
jgi:hypothetical protein